MKYALITGASRGIGAATAAILAENGYGVFIHFNHSSDKALQLKDSLCKKGLSAAVIQADVSDPEEVRKMFNQINEDCGGIDILVNNAGIAQSKLFTDITDEDWNQMISVNLSGAFYCCRAALPHMISQHYGRIINISSMWGQTGGSCEVHYSASKAGIIGLTKALAAEEGLSGITVNCIAPGVIRTDMTSMLTEDDFRALADDTPTGSIGEPQDIARTVLFLSDEKSSFITGQVFAVNGGIIR